MCVCVLYIQLGAKDEEKGGLNRQDRGVARWRVGGMSRGEVGGNREFVCSPHNGNARWTWQAGRERQKEGGEGGERQRTSVCARYSSDRRNGKIDYRGRVQVVRWLAKVSRICCARTISSLLRLDLRRKEPDAGSRAEFRMKLDRLGCLDV